MEYLTFGEQVKIILGRKGMTIKQLACMIEQETGKKMSRQNLTQRLGRDNFQEQDMRMIAAILGCPFHLSIMSVEGENPDEEILRTEWKKTRHTQPKQQEEQEMYVQEELPLWDEPQEQKEDAEREEAVQEEEHVEPEEAVLEEKHAEPEEAVQEEEHAEPEEAVEQETEENLSWKKETAAAVMEETAERDMTIGELYDIHEELDELEENVKAGEPVEAIKEELEKPKKERFSFFRRRHTEHTVQPKPKKEEYVKEAEPVLEKPSVVEEEHSFEPVITYDDAEEDTTVGEVNPYTGREYQSNSVRMHPTRIGYVQVYDRTIHKWTDMTEWAFLGYQERKKALLGKAYEPPIYLD